MSKSKFKLVLSQTEIDFIYDAIFAAIDTCEGDEVVDEEKMEIFASIERKIFEETT